MVREGICRGCWGSKSIHGKHHSSRSNCQSWKDFKHALHQDQLAASSSYVPIFWCLPSESRVLTPWKENANKWVYPIDRNLNHSKFKINRQTSIARCINSHSTKNSSMCLTLLTWVSDHRCIRRIEFSRMVLVTKSFLRLEWRLLKWSICRKMAFSIINWTIIYPPVN